MINFNHSLPTYGPGDTQYGGGTLDNAITAAFIDLNNIVDEVNATLTAHAGSINNICSAQGAGSIGFDPSETYPPGSVGNIISSLKSVVAPSGETYKIQLWLQQQLGKFLLNIKTNVKAAIPAAQVGILLYTPTVLMNGTQVVLNLPVSQYSYPNFDFFQVEDYEWVVPSVPSAHNSMYTFAQNILGYPSNKVDFFAGYVNDVESWTGTNWQNILTAANTSVSSGLRNTYIWAGTQVRQDDCLFPVGAPTALPPVATVPVLGYGQRANQTGRYFSGYYPTWSEVSFSASGKTDAQIYAASGLAQVPGVYTHVMIAFAQPNFTWNGLTANVWTGTGIQFASTPQNIVQSIRILKNLGKKVILSVGGAAYSNWAALAAEAGQSGTPIKTALAQIVADFNFDGLDIDFEIAGATPAIVTEYISVIQCMRELVDTMPGKTLSIATWSIGADYTASTPTDQYYPGLASWWGGTAGRERLAFKATIPSGTRSGQLVGAMFDLVNVMSYDVQYTYFDPIVAFLQYRRLVPQTTPVGLGIEIPPEGWPGAVLVINNADAASTGTIMLNDQYRHVINAPYSVERACNYLLAGGYTNANPQDGLMLWHVLALTSIAAGSAMSANATTVAAKVTTMFNYTPPSTSPTIAYNRFAPDLLKVVSNIEMAMSLTTSGTSAKVVGNFRTIGDFGSVVWDSSDIANMYVGTKNHVNTSYTTNNDYTGQTLMFTLATTGFVTDYADTAHKQSMVVTYLNGTQSYVTLGWLRPYNQTTDAIVNLTNTLQLSHTWVKWSSIVITYLSNSVLQTLPASSIYSIDYVAGTILLNPGTIPGGTTANITYQYATGSTYTFNFSQLFQGLSPADLNYAPVATTNIQTVTLPVIPTGFISGPLVGLGNSQPFSLTLGNIVSTGPTIQTVNLSTGSTGLSLCEDYDNEYYRNPTRLVQLNYLLGFRNSLTLFIGCLTAYDRVYASGVVSTGVSGGTLLGNTMNAAATAWWTALANALVAYGYTNLVFSMSLESHHWPSSWTQVGYDGVQATTGYNPPTSVCSPCSTQALSFLSAYAIAALQIVQTAGLTPVLQIGEPWWWTQQNSAATANEFCCYDMSTQLACLAANGISVPIF